METTLEFVARPFVSIRLRYFKPFHLLRYSSGSVSISERPILLRERLCLCLMLCSKIPAGKHLMDLVAVDWLKDTKRMDHVARRQGCAAQVSSYVCATSLAFSLYL